MKRKKGIVKKGKHLKNNKVLIVIPIMIIILIICFTIHLIFINKQSSNMNKIAKNYTESQKLAKELGSKKKKKKFNLSKAYYINYPYFKYDILNNHVNNIVSDIIKTDCTKNIGSSLNEVIHNNYTYCVVDYESYLAPDGIIGIALINTKLNNKGKILKQHVLILKL